MSNNNYDNIIGVLENLLNGKNPLTGEDIDYKDLTTNVKYASIIDSLAKDCEFTRKKINFTSGTNRYDKVESNNLLNRNTDMIINDLREWRYSLAHEQGVPLYVIMKDETMFNIAASDICKKEELMLVKGIGKLYYERYADDIFEILSKYIKDTDEDILSSKLTSVSRMKEDRNQWKENVKAKKSKTE